MNRCGGRPGNRDPRNGRQRMSGPHALVEHFFRYEFGRLVAVLTRSLGVRRLDLVEDVVQAALVQALETWSRRGAPEDPAGWLYRTARNLAIDALRRERTHAQALPRLAEDAERESSPLEAHFADEIGCASWTWIMTRRRPPSLALGSTRSSGSFISFSVRAATSPMATCRSAAVPGDSSEPSPAAPAGAAGPLRLPRPRILPQRPRSAHGRSASPRRKAR